MKELSVSAIKGLNKSIDFVKTTTDSKLRTEYFLYGISFNSTIKRSINRFNASIFMLREKINEYTRRTYQDGMSNIVFDKTTYTTNLINLLDNASLIASEFNLNYISCEMIYLAMLSTPNCGAYKFLSLIFKIAVPQYSLEKIYQETKELFLNEFEIMSSNDTNPISLPILDEDKENRLELYKKTNAKEKPFGIDLVELARNGKISPVIGRNAQIDRTINVLSRKTKNNPVLIGEPGVGKTAIVEGLAYAIANNEIPRLKNCKIISLNMTDLVSGSKYRGDFEQKLMGVIEKSINDPNIVLFIDEIHTVCGAGSSEGSIDASNILKPYLARGEISIIGATTINEYKIIEKDAALERRFQPIIVPEPTVEECTEILLGVIEKYEDFHHVIIQDEVIPYCVKLANRYIQDRFLPDKAFDLLDETCSKLSRKNKSDNESTVVFKNHIRDTLVELTGISIPDEQNEDLSYLNVLEQNLKDNLIGQDNAIEKVCKVIRRNRVGLNDPKKPIGSFIFAGLTGVGKTELAKKLCVELFGTQDDLIRIDMSEYMTKENVSKLIGAAPGYVGYEEEGFLTKSVRRKPYSIILFDEIEKAHPDIFNILLQVLDDGILSDSMGRKINFKNTIIIMTTNQGYEAFSAVSTNNNPIGFTTVSSNEEARTNKDIVDAKVKESLKTFFRPEFLNRIDDIIIFNQLGKEDSLRITKLLFTNLENRLRNQNVDITFDTSVIEFINEIGFDRQNGARPLKRAIQSNVEDALADSIINRTIDKNLPIYCKLNENRIVFYNI